MRKSTKKKRPDRHEFSDKVGANVRYLREKKGLTLLDLSGMTGLDPSILSKLERGETIPRLDTFVKVCGALGVKIDDMM